MMTKPRHARIWIEGRIGNLQDATLKPPQADDGSAVLPHNPVMQVATRSSPTGWPGQTWPGIFSATRERPPPQPKMLHAYHRRRATTMAVARRTHAKGADIGMRARELEGPQGPDLARVIGCQWGGRRWLHWGEGAMVDGSGGATSTASHGGLHTWPSANVPPQRSISACCCNSLRLRCI
jgi:hypothetical protein